MPARRAKGPVTLPLMWPIVLSLMAIARLNSVLATIPERITVNSVFTSQERFYFDADYKRLGLHLQVLRDRCGDRCSTRRGASACCSSGWSASRSDVAALLAASMAAAATAGSRQAGRWQAAAAWPQLRICSMQAASWRKELPENGHFRGAS